MGEQPDILEKYGELIQFIPDIVCITNKERVITHCNERLLKQLGSEKKRRHWYIRNEFSYKRKPRKNN